MNEKRKEWHVYMVLCADGTLYTGITNDLGRRLSQHNSAKAGARYTRGRQPVILAYQENCPDRSVALKREAQLRKLSVHRKHDLIHLARAKVRS